MTNKEAAAKLKMYKRTYWRTDDPEKNEALDLAIRALESNGWIYTSERLPDPITRDTASKDIKQQYLISYIQRKYFPDTTFANSGVPDPTPQVGDGAVFDGEHWYWGDNLWREEDTLNSQDEDPLDPYFEIYAWMPEPGELDAAEYIRGR